MNKIVKPLISMLLCVVMLSSILFGFEFFPETVYAQMTDDAEAAKMTGEKVVAKNTLKDIELEQSAVNETNVTIRITDVNSILDKADSIKIIANMYYNDEVTRSVEETISLENNQDSYSLDFKDFGKYTVQTEYLKDNNSISKSEDIVMGIGAEEYNLALLNGSFPVALFTLSIFDGITVNAEGKDIPTFAAFERQSAWNWDNLPQNTYKLPTLPKDSYNNAFADWIDAQKRMASYAKDLYEISPDAHFHLYTVDNYVEHIFMFLVANQIPEEQYNVILLSDGSGTYSIFNRNFQNDDGTKYDDMCAEWENIKIKTKENGKFDPSGIKYLNDPKYECLSNYPAVAAADENVEWWVARTSGTFSIGNSELLTKITNLCTVKNLSAMLVSVQNNNKTDELKTLYHFNNDMFSAADTNGKPVMLILGSRVTSEANFEDYAKMVMKYYGDTYEYYYKGHPGTPTILYPSKQAQLEKLGITDVDSSIPAELILFFFPDIYMCGYDSTTFQSVESEKMACGMFNMKKATGLTKTYGELLDFFSSSINSDDTTYGKYCTNPEHTYYLLEFNDITEHVYAIYDAVDNTFAYDKELEPKPEKKTPTIMSPPTASPIKEGQSLKDSLLSGGNATVDASDISGCFQWKDESIKPSITDSNNTKYSVVFIPSDTENYDTAETTITITVNATIKENENPNNSSQKQSVKNGDIYRSGNAIYKVKSISANTVSYMGCKKNSTKTVKIPSSIKINGKVYKVTAIAANAFKNKKKLQRVTIGSNIISIGKNAFYGWKNLKKITISSKKLKSVGKNSIKGISKKAVIKMPKSKEKKYKKLLTKKTGYKRTMRIK